jgi:hypothetical protein
MKYLPDGWAIREFFEPHFKIPLNPPFQRGMMMGSPLWQRGVRGDFPKKDGSVGVTL